MTGSQPLGRPVGEPPEDDESPEAKRRRLAALLAARVADDVDSHPLSHNQRSMWFIQRLAPQSSAYNLAVSLRFRSELDVGRLEAAVQTLVDRHASLRTHIDERNGEPVQIVSPRQKADFVTVDATGWSDGACRARLDEELRTPFDLTNDDLMRVRLCRRNKSDHWFQLVIHHIVTDGWSLWLMLDELRQLYSASVDGRDPGLPRLSNSYGDFVRWQQELIDTRGDDLLGFWTDTIGDAPNLDLPTDDVRPAVSRFEGATRRFEIGEERMTAVRQLARTSNTTVFTVMTTIFQTLLHRYTGQRDILLGTPVLGRSRTEFTSIVGDFVNTAVLRGQLEPERSFAAQLQATRSVINQAIGHQDYPFALIVQELAPERDLSRNPIVQASINLMQPPPGLLALARGEGDSIAFGGIEVEGLGLEAAQQEGQFDLNLEMVDLGAEVAANLKYRTDLFTVETIDQMVGHLLAVLDRVVEDQTVPLGEIRLIDPPAVAGRWAELNETERPRPDVSTVAELIERQADATPDRVAAVDETGTSLTYRQLLDRAEGLAATLSSAGVSAGDVVGVLAGRRVDLLVTLLGIWKAGAAYLPLDPTFPADRLADIIADAGIDVAVADDQDAPCLASVPVVLNMADAARPAAPPTTTIRAPRPGAAAPTAYLIYTSGSTGRPKGVEVGHDNVLNLLASMADRPGCDANDVVLALTTISFDISVLELFLPLTVGARVVVADDRTGGDPSRLADVIERHGITFLQATPSSWSMLRADGWQPPPALRCALAGGEALPRALADDLLSTGLDLWNVYGPTETTVWSSAGRVEPGTGRIELGRPIANTRLHVVDPTGRPAPCGVPGELLIGGSGVTRGYVGRPDETAARFVSRPDLDPDRPRLYRTGDLVVRKPSGALHFLGRIDHQVKLRGHRIELGEIEAVVSELPSVEQAVVVASGDGPDTRLIGYLTGRSVDDTRASTDAVADHLRSRLPEYMIPSAILWLDELPETPNRKVDRAALAARPVLVEPENDLDQQPRTETERLVAGLMTQVLGRGTLGRNADFFQLGGHSLLATQLVSRIESATDHHIPLAEFFDRPTPAGLADIVDRDRSVATELPPLVPVGRDEPIRLSFAQERMWFMHELAPGNSAYHVVSAFEVDGALDEDAFVGAVSAMVERHEGLRTLITMGPDGPVQSVIEPFPIPRNLIDLSHLGPNEQDTARDEVFAEQIHQPFDFKRYPAWRMVVIRLEPERHIVLAVMHHVIFDQWSQGVFLTELVESYLAIAEGRRPELAPLTVQYPDFAAWQRSWLQGDALEDGLGYWRRQLDAMSTLSLPTDRPRPPIQSLEGEQVLRPLPAELLAKVREAAVARQATPFMVLLAGFGALLQRYTGQTDIAVGVPVANRHRLPVEAMLGTFVNSLVLRNDLDGDPTFAELLERTRAMTLDAYANQELPFERLVDDLVTERDLSRTPLFQVMFNMINAPFDVEERDDVGVRSVDLSRGVAQFDLTFTTIMDEYGTIEPKVVVEYATSLFDRDTVERLVDHYIDLLDRLLTEPGRPIAGHELLDRRTKDELIAAWSDADRPYRTDATIHDLVAEQATRSPEAIAVTDETGELSYADLRRRSAAMAEQLRHAGAGPGRFVGLYLERGCDLVVALLAVLESGSAYLPLDPAFPADRLAFMLQDAAAPILITQPDLADRAPHHDGVVVLIDGHRIETVADRDRGAAADPGAAGVVEPGRGTVAATDLAYVIYTSGSTGRPKGVAVEHRSVVNFLTSMADRPGLRADDTLLSVTTLSFDISVLEIFLPLIVGARVVVVSRDTAADGARLGQAMADHGATVVQATPATWSMLIDAGWTGTGSMRAALCGGEALPRDLADDILARCDTLWNMYGPTETTIWSAVERIEPGDGMITIGRPIANTSFAIVDGRDRPVPVGVPGELLIGGHGLARGYLGRPELTAERFGDDLLDGPCGNRWYRTGDLARFRSDDSVEFMGRLDFQVKVRGFRIELGEIEHAMDRHPSLRESVVVARPDVAGDSRLVAYYLLRAETADVTVAQWREFLADALPNYMIPSIFVAVEGFPLTPNRKIDRRSLPDPPDEIDTGSEFVAPRNQTEAGVAAIWSELLDRPSIGVNDDFFALGGHSLLAVRIFARIRSELGAELDLSILFDRTTVAEIAEVIDTEGGGGAAIAGTIPGYRYLVDVHAGDPTVGPFFCVHGAGGQVLFMQDWRPHLGPVPLVAIQAAGFDGRTEAHGSIEEMAAGYVEEVCRHRPTGSLRIGGYSGGGTVAFEMVRQLQAAGRDVEILVLIDTFHPHVQPRTSSIWERVRGWARHPGQKVRKTYRTRILWPLVDRRVKRSGGYDDVAGWDREVYMFDHLDSIRLQYHPVPIDVPVVLLRAEDTWEIYDHVERERGWSELIPELVIRDIPGDHNTIIGPPNLATTVARLVDTIADSTRRP